MHSDDSNSVRIYYKCKLAEHPSFYSTKQQYVVPCFDVIYRML